MADPDPLQAAYRHSSGGRGAEHLSEAQWERLACDELGPRERERALEHILECPTCSRIHRALLDLRLEAATFDDGMPAPVRTTPSNAGPRRWVSWRGLGILAVAATVVLAVVLPLRRGQEPVMRPDGDVVRGVDTTPMATPVEPVGDVDWRPGDDLPLLWTSPVVDHPAEVEVLDDTGELAWTSPQTTASRTVWPGELIPGPGTYYWRVVVHDPSAGDSASELVSFTLVTASLP